MKPTIKIKEPETPPTFTPLAPIVDISLWNVKESAKETSSKVNSSVSTQPGSQVLAY